MVGFFEIGEWSLLDPGFLLGIPLLLLVAVWRRLRPRAALPAAQTALFAGLPRTFRARCVHLPLWLSVLAGLLLILALARPVRREVVPQTEEGVDIVLAVDISSSMQIEDMSESESLRRIDSARQRALEFAAARPDDRLAFIAFARYGELRCPPTLDEEALAAFLRSIDVVPQNSELDGTAIGVALAKAVQVLEGSDAKSRIVVLLSDGENNQEAISLPDAARLASDAGIRVHTIGLGHGVPTPFGFRELDFQGLRTIAKETGGKFFQARSDADLAEVYQMIDSLEKTELEDPRYRTIDGFEWPLGTGLSLLLAALLLEVLWIRGRP